MCYPFCMRANALSVSTVSRKSGPIEGYYFLNAWGSGDCSQKFPALIDFLLKCFSSFSLYWTQTCHFYLDVFFLQTTVFRFFFISLFLLLFFLKTLKSEHDSPSLAYAERYKWCHTPFVHQLFMIYGLDMSQYFRIRQEKNQWKIWHYRQPCLYKERKWKSPCS